MISEHPDVNALDSPTVDAVAGEREVSTGRRLTKGAARSVVQSRERQRCGARAAPPTAPATASPVADVPVDAALQAAREAARAARTAAQQAVRGHVAAPMPARRSVRNKR